MLKRLNIKYISLITLLTLVIISVSSCSTTANSNLESNNDTPNTGKTEINQDINNKKESNNTVKENLSFYYTCPMHPEIKENTPGTCPKCNMFLEKKELKKNEKS
ncbi:MAG: heavy metal-binding domain-containing protein [Cyanobacteriota bacterium]